MDKILSEFKELYAELINCVPENKRNDMNIFYHEAGKQYFQQEPKILFVGRSVNGWVNKSWDVNELFDEKNNGRIVNRDDRLFWIERNDNPEYNTNNSAFLRLMRKIPLEFYQSEDWYNKIAWTNLYKLSPGLGNPPSWLCNLQQDWCIKILNKEIEYLHPKHIIFLTSSWEKFYLESIGFDFDKNRSIDRDIYKTFYQDHKNRIYIQSQHPQGINESAHIEAILKILNLFK